MKTLIQTFLELPGTQDLMNSNLEFFLSDLDKSIDLDLWRSVGGHWSEASQEAFRAEAIKRLSKKLLLQSEEGEVLNPDQCWVEIVREFHSEAQGKIIWGQSALLKKEKKPLTEEQKNHRKLFMYIWAMMQTAIVTKTAIFYFGLKSAEEGTLEGKIYVTLAMMTTLVSLTFFALRNYKDN